MALLFTALLGSTLELLPLIESVLFCIMSLYAPSSLLCLFHTLQRSAA